MKREPAMKTTTFLLGIALAFLHVCGQARSERLGMVFSEWPPAPEAAAALAFAESLDQYHGQVARLAITDSGFALAETLEPVDLSELQLLWVHAGDSTAFPPAWQNNGIGTLIKGFLSEGHGLVLSGAAPRLLFSWGIESIQPRAGGPGKDSTQASAFPETPEHPVFRHIALTADKFTTSNSGFPAFADFYGTGGPYEGAILARTGGGSEHPIVEYQVQAGRIIAIGWRLPHFSNDQNPYRQTLETLFANALDYVASPVQWVDIHANRGGISLPEGGFTPAEAAALKSAVLDLADSFPEEYPDSEMYLDQLDSLLQRRSRIIDAEEGLEAEDINRSDFIALRNKALRANPLLNFNELMLIRRDPRLLGLSANWESNSSLPTHGYQNEIAVLPIQEEQAPLRTLFKPSEDVFVGDVDLHFDGGKILFSMPAPSGQWQVFEYDLSQKELTQLPLIDEPDVDNYDACYLPDGNIIFTSTAPFVGVPCVTGSAHVSNLYHLDRASGRITRKTFEQDHDWCPTVLNNGRLLYLRWEYSDIPHFASRILFHMNPDGSEQMEYYGSNSYWPNSMFYARPVPDSATKFVAIVSGHHDVPRMGELILFDTAQGRTEADGVVQRIPGRGKPVEPVIRDALVVNSWPKFLHPFPLNDRYFIVSCKPREGADWGIYIADIFDNIVPLRIEPGYALLEPIPLRAVDTPPVIPSKIDPENPFGEVFLTDIYQGKGLAGVPRGTIKKLRILSYHFAYHGMGGQVNRIGLDGPWDVKRIVGTVPVMPDGSAYFKVPANTPISIQPLDEEGKAVQLMRSWMTAMPGEVLSCVGCHEPQNSVSLNRRTMALDEGPAEITPWYGPARGFSFDREVQPVLDAYCVDCHDEQHAAEMAELPIFTRRPHIHPEGEANAYNNGSKFPPAYLALRRFARPPTIESDLHLLPPGEFHADTSRFVQLLSRGHYGVELSDEAWDRLVTWLDLGAPAHGTWHEIVGWDLVTNQRERRSAMLKKYTIGRNEDPEAIYPNAVIVRPYPAPTFPSGELEPLADATSFTSGLSSDADRNSMNLELAEGIDLSLAMVPQDEHGNQGAFWMSTTEITNQQYALFDPDHDTGLEHGDFLQFSIEERGYPMNRPSQPVARVSWDEANEFCRWLSARTGRNFTLPSAGQWDQAFRFNPDPMADSELPRANLADLSLFRIDTFGWSLPSGAIPPWRPHDQDLDDGYRVSADVGSFPANPLGIYDLLGNVAEWTATPEPGATDRILVRGGSWYQRRLESLPAVPRAHKPFLGIYDVGFRVICPCEPEIASASR
jgi:formylglycine-generating enzyme required for sulfatase activity